ncbi:hypothetical protein FB446DRAFT_788937 [Lentinula raphanica]|nr:hypothetical protein FB446DRAFT_788937 [Lentinula raphanica]
MVHCGGTLDVVQYVLRDSTLAVLVIPVREAEGCEEEGKAKEDEARRKRKERRKEKAKEKEEQKEKEKTQAEPVLTVPSPTAPAAPSDANVASEPSTTVLPTDSMILMPSSEPEPAIPSVSSSIIGAEPLPAVPVVPLQQVTPPEPEAPVKKSKSNSKSKKSKRTEKSDEDDSDSDLSSSSLCLRSVSTFWIAFRLVLSTDEHLPINDR